MDTIIRCIIDELISSANRQELAGNVYVFFYYLTKATSTAMTCENFFLFLLDEDKIMRRIVRVHLGVYREM